MASIKCPFARNQGERRWVKIRAHINPLSHSTSYICPSSPAEMDWRSYFPQFLEAAESHVDTEVRIADIGCGFGGLLEALAPLFPDKMIVGMEIRSPVVRHVEKRLKKLQDKAENWPSDTLVPAYSNTSVIYTNVMKHLVRFFKKGQLEKMFFLFPDPHFKKTHFRRRIVSTTLLAEYAYVLKVGGLAYNITDVEGLYTWTVEHFDAHPLFERVSEEELKSDPAVPAMLKTDEANKVAKRGDPTFMCVYRRIEG